MQTVHVFPVPEQPGSPAEDVLFALGHFDRQLAELREAARRPRSRFPLHYEDGMTMPMPHLRYLQSATAVLRLRALAELELGRADEALADLQLGFRLMRAVENEPTLISLLVRLSMLELIQLNYMSIMIGEGRNNFIIEWNENREEDNLDLSAIDPQVN